MMGMVPSAQLATRACEPLRPQDKKTEVYLHLQDSSSNQVSQHGKSWC